jgi:nitroimidazol reductase NimA-like FMN-containing flavoprotein (pyridoxamine 5'-phosphate oxidase superfamily)
MSGTQASRYHPTRIEKDMPSPEDQLAVIREQAFLTIALCHGNEPYLVTLNYAFDEAQMCFYVHCANKGRKLDILRENPRVWGQVIEDRGYIKDECSHAYRAVMFEGEVEWVEEVAAKQAALALMIDKYEAEPGPMKERLLGVKGLAGTTVLRIRVIGMSGKQSPARGNAEG